MYTDIQVDMKNPNCTQNRVLLFIFLFTSGFDKKICPSRRNSNFISYDLIYIYIYLNRQIVCFNYYYTMRYRRVKFTPAHRPNKLVYARIVDKKYLTHFFRTMLPVSFCANRVFPVGNSVLPVPE